MVVRTAAHKDEEIIDPVGDSKPEEELVEGCNGLRIWSKESDVPELQRPDAGDLLVVADMTQFQMLK